MSKLTILQWSAGKREVHFVGFNRDHTACFIRDEQNTRQAITLRLPKLFEIRFYQNPIGKDGSPPVEINRAALHLPACFATKKEKEAFDDPHSTEVQCTRTFAHHLWKAVSNHKCWLEPENDEELAKLLQMELDRQRHLYAIRQKETDERAAAINQEIVVLPPSNTAHVLEFYQNRIKELQDILRGEFATYARNEHGSFKIISVFDVPLSMVREGWAGLRERLLEREWAEHFGLNLQTIPTEAAAFHAWLERHAYNARQRTEDMQIGTAEIGVGLKLDPWQWEVLEAAVRYKVRFADGASCWLDDIEERAVTDPQEVEDFDKLEVSPSHATADPKHIELLAEAQRMLSGGIMLNVGPLVQKMTPNEKLLFNWLVAKNHSRPGWALSYREIGERLSVSQTEVQRRRKTLERKYGQDIARFIAEARAKNEKGMNPDQCASGRKMKTVNISPDAKAD